MCVVDGEKHAVLTTSQGVLFYNMWSRRGEWVGINELLTGMDGQEIPSEDPLKLVHVYICTIRKKLREAGIDVVIENQRQSFWAEPKYRIL